MDFLLLTTPTQHAAHNPAVELNPRRLRQWLYDLPIMNVAETVRLLDSRIGPFNEMMLDPEERLKLLEVLFEAFDEILFSYDDLRLSMLPVTPAERRQLAQDILWLYLQLAAGYKIIVMAHFSAGGKGIRTPTLHMALFRAMELLTHALLYAFRAHEAPPPLTWLEFYQLYRYARERKLHQLRLRPIRGYAATPTIERLFKQTLLLSVADPGHMSGQAVFENHLLLETVCDAAEIGALDGCPTDQPVYRFLYDEDAPPRHCAHVEAADAAAEGGLLFVAGAVEKLNAQATASGGHEARLLRDLAARLEHAHHRRDARHPANRTVQLSPGASSVVHFLSDSARLDKALQAEVHAGIEVMDLDSADAAECFLLPARVRNLSQHGYLLECETHPALADDGVGDVIGIADQQRENAPPMQLGLIRWARKTERHTLHLGVEVFAGPPRPIRIHPCNGKQPTADGFHLPLDKEAKRPARLLIPAVLADVDGPLLVQIASQSHTVTLQRILSTTERWILTTFVLQP